MTTQQQAPTSEELRERVRQAERDLRDAQAREAEQRQRERYESQRAYLLRIIEQREAGQKRCEGQIAAAQKELKRLDRKDVAALKQAAALGDRPSQRALDDFEAARHAARESIRQATQSIEGYGGHQYVIAEARRELEKYPSLDERAGIVAAAGKAIRALRGEGD